MSSTFDRNYLQHQTLQTQLRATAIEIGTDQLHLTAILNNINNRDPTNHDIDLKPRFYNHGFKLHL
jgi:hypothetical protein